jgi:hypothetical protein
MGRGPAHVNLLAGSVVKGFRKVRGINPSKLEDLVHDGIAGYLVGLARDSDDGTGADGDASF